MANKYDVLTVREYTTSGGEKKSSWTRVGVMFPARSGDGFSIMLDALPIDGKLVCRVPRERDEPQRRPARREQAPSGGGGFSDADYGASEDDSSIPF